MGGAGVLAAGAPYRGVDDHSARLAQGHGWHWPDRCQCAREAWHRARGAPRRHSHCAGNIGGLCIALGLITRFFAVAIAVEMAVIVHQYFPKFGWTGPGYEYPLMWGLIMLAIALRGGGPYSLDRRLGREL